jgi:hypothetical protein
MDSSIKYLQADPSPDVGFLVGMEVEQIWVWGPVRLVFDLGRAPEPGVYVDAWWPFYRAADGGVVEVNVAASPGDSGRILELLGKRVSTATVAGGELVLSFGDGAEFRIPPDSEGEAWTVAGGGRTYISMPGGEIHSG